MLHFYFWEECYIKSYAEEGQEFPSESSEILVHFVGYAECIGSYITFKVYNPKTGKILYRSKVKKRRDDGDDNNSLGPRGSPDDPDIPQVITSPEREKSVSVGFDPTDLVGRYFLCKPNKDGTRDLGLVTECLDKFTGTVDGSLENIKFKVKKGLSDKEFEEIVEYNDMCEFVTDLGINDDGTYKFDRILQHRDTGRGRRKKYEVLIEWRSGERTWEPIRNIYLQRKNDLAQYAEENGLLDEWDSPSLKLKQAAARAKKTFQFSAAVKLLAKKTDPIYMFGEQVPRNHEEAMELDMKNGNTKWADAEKLEVQQRL